MTANILSLPIDLLMEIFAYLPYWDLKLKLPFVNKRFNAITDPENVDTTQTGSLALALFRDYPTSASRRVDPKIYDEREVFQLHPLFPPRIVFRPLDGNWLYGNWYGSGRRTGIAELPFARDNAVSPAVTHLILRPHWGPRQFPFFLVFGATPGAGVTVLDVLNGIYDMFYSGTDVFVRGQVFNTRLEDWEGWEVWNACLGPRRVLESQGWYLAGVKVGEMYREVLTLSVQINMRTSLSRRS